MLSLLTGCSALRLGYSQGPTIAYWWLDSYLDFDSTQKQPVRDALGQWFAWHRKTELPQLAAILDRAAVDVMSDATTAQACRWSDEIRLRLDAAVEHALPGAAEVALLLRPEQLDALRKRQARANEEFREEYMQPRPEARAKADLERAVERSEMLYGRLDAAQRERFAQIIAASPFDPERWLAERQRRQRDLLQALQQIQSAGLGRAEALAALRGYWQRARRSPDEIYGRYAQQLNAYNCAAAAQLHNLTTPAQREHARARLRGWEADLRALASSTS
ncbi:DUF6279 family lipoprotein [Rivibacter subsaxonicus]|uniref:DUF6279 family lipoprotein n=1 Tax=Rivibacter subsaxonicus TaxID=457575 RepID=UPI001F5EBEBD|nr:DUF6279 family lipoprotein [Rivibacter subsaxonicus]